MLFLSALGVLALLCSVTLGIRELPAAHAIAVRLRVERGARLLSGEIARNAIGSMPVGHPGRSIELVDRLRFATLLAAFHSSIVRARCDGYARWT